MIDRLRILLRVGLALVLLAPLGACTGAEESGRSADERPNILFIVTDDQAPWAFQLEDHPELTTARMGPVPSSARRHGFIADSSQLRTPHMSEIATEGAYLVNAYTPTPVCSPSRASLLTSRYGSEVGITDWLNPSWDGTLAGPEPDLGLDTTYVTWTELLQDAEQPDADRRTDRATGQHHRAELHVDIVAPPVGHHPGDAAGDQLVGLGRDCDRWRHADENQQRRHEKAPADTEHSGQEADQPTHTEYQQGVDRHLGNREIDLHEDRRVWTGYTIMPARQG